MAWTNPVTWLAGSTLTAAQLNEQVRDNSLAGGPIFATTAARDAAITAPFAGQRAFVSGTNVNYQYNGTAWVSPQALAVPPMASVIRSTNLTGYTANALVAWESAAYDTESPTSPMWSATNADRVTIRTTGVYSLSLRYAINATATISLIEVDFYLNATIAAVINAPVISTIQAYGSVTHTQKCTAGDFVAASFVPTGGSAYVVRGAAGDNYQQTRLTVTFLGKIA